MEFYISPYSTTTSRPFPHDYTAKVTLFWERFHGWKFLIAKRMLDGYLNSGNQPIPGIPDAGYAAMDVMFSYFEPLGKHLEGYLDPKGEQKSGKYFKKGVHNVFPTLKKENTVIANDLLNSLWKGIRCGLYHSGKTKNNILITGDTQEALRFSSDDKVLIINPHKLADGLIWHIACYRDRLLKEGENSVLGKNFIARYDYDNPTT